MNKLCSLGKHYRNLSAISKIYNARNLSVVGTKNQLRLSSSDAKSKQINQETNVTQTELDKPQWERSDRYVSFILKKI